MVDEAFTLTVGVVAKHVQLTRTRLENAAEHLDRGGLSRAVRTDVGNPLAPLDGKADLPDCRHLAVIQVDKVSERAP